MIVRKDTLFWEWHALVLRKLIKWFPIFGFWSLELVGCLRTLCNLIRNQWRTGTQSWPYVENIWQRLISEAAYFRETNYYHCYSHPWHTDINSIQYERGGVAKSPLPSTRFSSVTSTKAGISSQNSLTFNFNPFAISSVSLKLLNLNQDHPWKKVLFLTKSL